MLILGITGGIGSGKGLAAEFFRTRGAAVIDADEIAHRLTQPGSALLAELAAAFGPGILRQDGSLDRRGLANACFGDPEALARLNAITHPPVKAEMKRALTELVKEGKTGIACIVAPLLLEAGCRDLVDRLLVLVADDEERTRRVMARDGLTQDEVRKRIAAQMPSSEQARHADWVVDTTRGREDVTRQLEAVWLVLSGVEEKEPNR
jgi:dephospho-CoA kinase